VCVYVRERGDAGLCECARVRVYSSKVDLSPALYLVIYSKGRRTSIELRRHTKKERRRTKK
jgi:hypothetical protein